MDRCQPPKLPLRDREMGWYEVVRFWGVFLDETRCEFGAPIEAGTKDEAWRIAAEDYPESKCVQLESPEETAEREAETYRRISEEMDSDCDYDDYDEEE